MKIGIIGAGHMGAALGQTWARRGHDVFFSYSRDEQKLAALAADTPGTRAGQPADAAAFGEVLMLAVPYSALMEVLPQLRQFRGRTVLTCVSGLRPDFSGQTVGMPTDLSTSVAEQIAAALPEAAVVEAFNTTFAEIIRDQATALGEQRASIFYCGDDTSAKAVAAQLIADAGFEGVDAGALRVARSLETLASVWVQFAVASGRFPYLGLRALVAEPQVIAQPTTLTA